MTLVKDEFDEEIYDKTKIILNNHYEEPLLLKETASGIGGWLILFCISLVILKPIRNYFSISSIHETFSPYYEQFPGVTNLFILSGATTSLLTLLGIYSGLMFRPPDLEDNQLIPNS